MPDSSAEKTESATAKRRQDERKKGNIFMSKEIVTLLTMIVSFYAFSFFIENLIHQIMVNYASQIERIATIDTLTYEEVRQMYVDGGVLILTTIIPAMLIGAATSVLVTIFQTKGNMSQEQTKFKMSRINLLNGFKKFFSLRSIVELLKSIIKITVLGFILYGRIQTVMTLLPSMMDWDIMQSLVYMGDEIMGMMLAVAIAFGAIALLDLLYQRWEFEKSIRMTKQEVKEEYIQMEGDPKIKSKRRQKQMEMAQRRMMQAIKDADVIVRNPTHYAVALKYTLDKDPAPMVLAKGADHVALRIVAEGEKHGIITVENKPLARGLYDAADIFGYIPAEFFQPVAELLAWIYSQRTNKENTYNPPSLRREASARESR
jgi:flagellar biosynthetic protein FlhB